MKISEKIKKEPEITITLMNMILVKIQDHINKLLGYSQENVDENYYTKTHTIFKEHNKYYENQIDIFQKMKEDL